MKNSRTSNYSKQKKTRIIKNCILCGSTVFTKLFMSKDRIFSIPGKYTNMQCLRCKVIFLNPQPSNRELEKHYPQTGYFAYKKEGKLGFEGKIREYIIKNYYNKNVISALLRFVVPNSFAIPKFKKNGRILDLGCGTGDILYLLKNIGWDVYGIEIYKNAVDVAHERGLKNVILGTYEALNRFPDNFFDAIRLYHVIEHLNNPPNCLELIYKKLKSEGQLILATPNIDSPLIKLFKNKWSGIDAPRHLFLFNPKLLSELGKRKKFKIERVEYSSAMGISGSILYTVNEIFNSKISVIGKLWILFYPLEWILDKLKLGDGFILRLRKQV